MKRYLAIAFAAIMAAVYVQAADITQTASYGVTDGARQSSLRDLVETDVPAIISAVNATDQLANDYRQIGAVTLKAAGTSVVIAVSSPNPTSTNSMRVGVTYVSPVPATFTNTYVVQTTNSVIIHGYGLHRANYVIEWDR